MTAFHELTDDPADLVLLQVFFDTLYVAEFPDPDERESLENVVGYLRLKGQGWYGPNNYHVVLAMSGAEIVAGVICDYVAGPRAGVLEFLLVAPSARGTGVGRGLLAHAEELLAADGELHCVVAEMNDPLRTPTADDNLDPVTRALIWHRWGYQGLDFPYVQPPLSDHQSDVDNLILLCKPLRDDWSDAVPARVLDHVVREYLHWAMRVVDLSTCPEYRRMADHLARRDHVGLLPLDRYTGAPLDVRPVVRADEPGFTATMDLYREVFPAGPLTVPEDDFRQALLRPDYHLWAVRAGDEVAGFASFFTLSHAGFLGYVALTGALRGRSLTRPLAARIETRLLADRPSVRGWYGEVGSGTDIGPFLRLGFHHLDVDYRQPTADGSVPIRLVFKPTGRVYGPPGLAVPDLLADLAEILRAVYGVVEPEGHPSYLRVAAGLVAVEVVPTTVHA